MACSAAPTRQMSRPPLRGLPVLALCTLLLLLAQLSRAGGPNMQSEYNALSGPCQNTLKGMLSSSSPIGSCTHIGQLVTDLAAGGTDSGTSVVGPISKWETDFCQTSGCTDGVVGGALKAVQLNCKSDLAQRKYLALVIRAALKNYKVSRSIACAAAKDAGDKRRRSDYCGRSVIQDLESASMKATGNAFTPSFISAVAAQPMAFIDSLKGTNWCSQCLNWIAVKAQPIFDDVEDTCSKDVNSLLTQKCGAKYDPKKAPGGVKDAEKDDAIGNYYASAASPSIKYISINVISLILLSSMYAISRR